MKLYRPSRRPAPRWFAALFCCAGSCFAQPNTSLSRAEWASEILANPSASMQEWTQAAAILADCFGDPACRSAIDAALTDEDAPAGNAMVRALSEQARRDDRITPYLAAHLAAARDALAKANTRLIDALREKYLAADPAERPATLVELIGDAQESVCLAGFDLAQRELSSGTQLPVTVADAALAKLEHSSPGVRQRAGSLVRQLAPEHGAEALQRALTREGNPQVAAGLLTACVRWPGPACVGPALTWAVGPQPARDAAFELLWKLWQAGSLAAPDDLRRVLALARATPIHQWQTSHVFLLANLGNDDDQERIVALLASDEPRLRKAAGEALLWEPQHCGALREAARQHSDLFEFAALAVMVHNPDAADLIELLTLPASREPERAASVVRVAEVMTTPQVLQVARDTSLPIELRDRLYRVVLSDSRASSDADAASPSALARANAAVELAELCLAQGRADDALTALSTLGKLETILDAQRVPNLRCAALLAFGRVELAQQTTGDADAWLCGIEIAWDKPHAPAALAALEQRFAGTLTPAQHERFTRVRERVTAHAKTAVRPASDGPG